MRLWKTRRMTVYIFLFLFFISLFYRPKGKKYISEITEKKNPLVKLRTLAGILWICLKEKALCEEKTVGPNNQSALWTVRVWNTESCTLCLHTQFPLTAVSRNTPHRHHDFMSSFRQRKPTLPLETKLYRGGCNL